MANAELFKYENSVRKAESAWDRQMKRDGHLKKESRDISEANTATMSPTARAFYNEYAVAKKRLDDEAVRTNLFGGSAADPDGDDSEEDAPKPKAAGKKTHLSVIAGQDVPNPDDVVTPEDVPRRVVTPEVLADYAGLCCAQTLVKDKPTAKVIELDQQHFVVVEVNEHFVLLNRCIHEDQHEGNKIPNLKDRDGDDWEGLLVKSGPGKSPSFVLLNSSQSVACVAGDPLGDLSASTG